MGASDKVTATFHPDLEWIARRRDGSEFGPDRPEFFLGRVAVARWAAAGRVLDAIAAEARVAELDESAVA